MHVSRRSVLNLHSTKFGVLFIKYTLYYILPDDGHFGFMGRNHVIASNLCQNRNPRGRRTKKVSSYMMFSSGSKVNFSGWFQRPFGI